MTAARAQRAYFHLQVAAGRLRAQADRACIDAAGITTAQAAALVVVAEHPGASQRHLARTLGQGEPAITTLVRRLVAADLVSREVSADDKRTRSLTITPAGREALARAEEAFGPVNRRIDDALSAEQVAELVAHLRAIARLPAGSG